jgi:ubiquinone/menaquinone biosynthesis C-methylase UbiE
MDGYLITQLLYVAAKLGIGDALAESPRSADALARELGVRAPALRRVLRGLAAEGILEERPEGAFSLAAAGECLRSGSPNSLCGAIIARGELYYRATAGLLEALRHGGSGFERVHGKPLFAQLAEDAERSAIFQRSMSDRARHEAEAVVAAYDFGRFRRVVDVGGGEGVLLAAILRQAPQLRAVLMDQPPVVERARARFEAEGLAQRCEFVSGDIFAQAPAGGDLYVLSRVLHNWDDEAARAVLARCRRAIAETGTLLLVEVAVPERAIDNAAAIRMDLHMLALLAGRERTAAEYERLLAAAGFRLTRTIPTRSPAGIAVLEAVPGP